MKYLLLALGCAGLMAQDSKVTPLATHPLPDMAGKEAVMSTVEYPPGKVDTAHRHNAHVFLYVLEGSVIMGVKGKPPVTLGPGQTFYESPSDIHEVGKNASATKPAKFLVVMIKAQGAPGRVAAQ